MPSSWERIKIITWCCRRAGSSGRGRPRRAVSAALAAAGTGRVARVTHVLCAINNLVMMLLFTRDYLEAHYCLNADYRHPIHYP